MTLRGAGLGKLQEFLGRSQARSPNILKELIDFRGTSRRGALHFAAEKGLTNECKILLEDFKFDINLIDSLGDTPLTCAANHGHTATAKYLLEKGAALLNGSGVTAMHYAAENGNIELMKVLLDKNLSVDIRVGFCSPLVIACGNGRTASVKFLLEHGANPNGQPGDLTTPLQEAIMAGSIPCVELLIKAQVDVEAAASGYYPSPLHAAAFKGIPKIIKILLQAKANPNAMNDDRISEDEDVRVLRKPLDVAIAFGNKRAEKILFPLTEPEDPDATSYSKCLSALYDISMENLDVGKFAAKFLDKYPDKKIDFMKWEDKVAKLQTIMSSNLYPVD